MPIYVGSGRITGIAVDPADPSTAVRRLTVMAPGGRNAVIHWGDGTAAARTHPASPQEVNIIAILIGMLLPYLGPMSNIEVKGFAFSPPQKLSLTQLGRRREVHCRNRYLRKLADLIARFRFFVRNRGVSSL